MCAAQMPIDLRAGVVFRSGLSRPLHFLVAGRLQLAVISYLQ